MTIGVLALQGDFEAHQRMIDKCGADISVLKVRDKSTFESCDALIIPGGESTTMSCLCDRYDLWNLLKERIRGGLPVLGTCAGMIMLAKDVQATSANIVQKTLQVLDIGVARNAYGRQVDSFEATLEMPALGKPPLEAIFIRAPQITHVGDGVEVLAYCEERPVAVRQGNIVAASFHPEMSDDPRLHQFWLGLGA